MSFGDLQKSNSKYLQINWWMCPIRHWKCPVISLSYKLIPLFNSFFVFFCQVFFYLVLYIPQHQIIHLLFQLKTKDDNFLWFLHQNWHKHKWQYLKWNNKKRSVLIMISLIIDRLLFHCTEPWFWAVWFLLSYSMKLHLCSGIVCFSACYCYFLSEFLRVISPRKIVLTTK